MVLLATPAPLPTRPFYFLFLLITIICTQNNNDNTTTSAATVATTTGGTTIKTKMKSKEEYQSSMSITDKIGQMSQIDIHLLYHEQTTTIDNAKIELYFGKYGIGSLLITPPSPGQFLTASEYRSIIISIQNTAQTYGRPPVLVGIDSVHGANYIRGAIMTPQQINIASTFNITNAYLAGHLAGHDTRAAGITWIFSPILGLGIESLWSRMYETFGEDPLVVGEMGKAIIKGIQHYDGGEKQSIPSRSAACAKHFIGYSAPRTGHDRSPSWIPIRHLYQYFLKPWKNVLQSNINNREDNTDDDEAIAMTVMESYTEYNGVPNVANKESLNDLLREQLGFDGVLITDYQEVENLVNWHKTAKDLTEAVKMTLSEGSVDISMIPFNFDGWKDNVLRSMNIDPTKVNVQYNEGNLVGGQINNFAPFPNHPTHVDINRIDESVRRILHLKERLNMFDEKLTTHDFDLNKVGSKEDQEMVYNMAKESIILTKNENSALPMINKKLKVHVTGPTADTSRYLHGGWTIQWQGATDEDSLIGTDTVLSSISSVQGWDVSSSCGVDILGEECAGDSNLNLHLVDDSDYVIVCIGEESYTEKPGDIRDLALPEGQIKFVKEVKSAMKGGKLIVVYFGGRPRLLKEIVQHADAFLLAFLPGPFGGRAVTDILTGTFNPSAKLPITYPKNEDKGGVPYWNAVTDMCTGTGSNDNNIPLPHWQYTRCEVEWPFGHGLSYTQFQYMGLKLSDTNLVVEQQKGFKGDIDVAFKVKNTGDRIGSEVIMLFLFVENRYVTPEHKLLFYFDKLELKPNEQKEIQTKLSLDHLRHIGSHDDTHFVIQPGMTVKIGIGPYIDCRTENSDLCSESIGVVVKGNDQYEPSCEAACLLWKKSDCFEYYNFTARQCWEQCLASDSFSGSLGWNWNYVSCIQPIVLGINVDKEIKCPLLTNVCRNIFQETYHGHTGTGSKSDGLDVIVAMIAGGIGITIMLFYLFQAQIERGSKEIEFTPISNDNDERTLA